MSDEDTVRDHTDLCPGDDDDRTDAASHHQPPRDRDAAQSLRVGIGRQGVRQARRDLHPRRVPRLHDRRRHQGSVPRGEGVAREGAADVPGVPAPRVEQGHHDRRRQRDEPLPRSTTRWATTSTASACTSIAAASTATSCSAPATAGASPTASSRRSGWTASSPPPRRARSAGARSRSSAFTMPTTAAENAGCRAASRSRCALSTCAGVIRRALAEHKSGHRRHVRCCHRRPIENPVGLAAGCE